MLYDESNNFYDYTFNEKNENYHFDSLEFEEEFNKTFNNMSFDIGNLNVNNFRHNAKVATPIEGLNKGNLFPESYVPYKKYVYSIKVSGKREEMLLKIQALCFAIVDLQLYLDLHPTETDKLELLKKYQNEVMALKKAYSREYNPLLLSDVESTKEFTWIDNPWPWDKGVN